MDSKYIIDRKSNFFLINKPSNIFFNEVNILSPQLQNFVTCHRLDHPTSGLLLLSLEQHKSKYLELFKRQSPQAHKLKKTYLCWTQHKLNADLLNQAINGFTVARYRSSKKTHFKLELPQKKQFHSYQACAHLITNYKNKNDYFKEFSKYNCYQIELITGTRHQIRSFFAWAKCPLVGDVLYNGLIDPSINSLGLHSFALEFEDPYDHSFYSFKSLEKLNFEGN